MERNAVQRVQYVISHSREKVKRKETKGGDGGEGVGPCKSMHAHAGAGRHGDRNGSLTR